MNEPSSSTQLRLQGDVEWETPGSWFEAYVGLGEKLMEIATTEGSSNLRVLLVVPRRELVAPAIGFGISRQRFLSQRSYSVELSMDELERLPAGTQIRAEWPHRTRDAVFLGLDKRTPPRILLEIDGVTQPPLGAKRIRIYQIGVPVPQGVKANKNASADNKQSLGVEKQFWNQVFPAATFFSEGTHFERQMETGITSPDLQAILEDETLTLRDAARFDYLSNDKRPHFINVFEKSVKFHDLSPLELDRMNKTDWIVLDGNSAVSLLASSEQLYGRRLLGIVEFANPSNQNPAFQAFLSEAGNLWQQNPQALFDWTPPAGSYIWSWGEKNAS